MGDSDSAADMVFVDHTMKTADYLNITIDQVCSFMTFTFPHWIWNLTGGEC